MRISFSISFLILLILELFLLFVYVVPFLQYNPLNQWDMVGHYYLSEYYETNLWPKFSGWNPYLFAGFPQGQFYPPLFHWITGGLGKLVGTFWSFKLILSVIMLLPPISFFYFLKKMGFDDSEAALSLLLMFIPMVCIGRAVFPPGGDYIATLNVGLVTHAFSIPLLFFYLGSLIGSIRSIKEKKMYKMILPSVLLAILFLTHIFTSLVAVICLVVIFVSNSLLRPETTKKLFFDLAKHCFLTFILIGFWVLPFLIKQEYTSPSPMPGAMAPLSPIYYILLIFAIFVMVVKKDERTFVLMALSTIFLLFFAFGSLILQVLPIQFWRFSLYPTLFLLASIGIIMPYIKRGFTYLSKIGGFKLDITKPKFISIFLIAITLIILYSVYECASTIDTHGAPKAKLSLPPDLDGRVFTLIVGGLGPTTHIIPHLVAFGKKEEVGGLFIESTKNGRYLEHLKGEISTDIGGAKVTQSIQNRTELLPYHFKYFGINYALTNINPVYFESIFGKIKYKYIETDSPYGYSFLIKVANHSTFEVLNYKPRKVLGNWKEEQWEWFFTIENVTKLITPDEIPDYVGTGEEGIRIIKKEPEHIILNVDSDQPVPIHVKIPYFPNWHAYVNGKQTEIYRIPINMMLIYGNGKVELKYEMIWSDYLGILLTLIGVGYVIFVVFTTMKKPKKSRKKGRKHAK